METLHILFGMQIQTFLIPPSIHLEFYVSWFGSSADVLYFSLGWGLQLSHLDKN